MHDGVGDIRAMFEARQGATGILDTDAPWTRLNSRFAALIGRPKDSFPGENLGDLCPSVVDAADAVHAQVMPNEKPGLGVRMLCAGLGATAGSAAAELEYGDFEEDWAPLAGDGFTGVAIHIHSPKADAARNLTTLADMRTDTRLRAFITETPMSIAMSGRNMHHVAACRSYLEAFGQPASGLWAETDASSDNRDMSPNLLRQWREGHGRVLPGTRRCPTRSIGKRARTAASTRCDGK